MEGGEQAEHRAGDEPKIAPVHRIVREVRHAEVALITLQELDPLGAGEQAPGLGQAAARGDLAGLALIDGLVHIHAVGGGDAKTALHRFGLFWNHRRQPVLVGQTRPAAIVADVGVALFLPVLEGLDAKFVLFAQRCDAAFVDQRVGIQDRFALMLHRAVGDDSHRRRRVVLDLLGDREHEVIVDGDGAAEDQALSAVKGERNRLAGAEHVARGLRPEAGGGRGVRRARPAELGEIGLLRAFGAEQLDLGRALGRGDGVLLEIEVVDPRAAQGDRALQRRGVDGHAGGGLQRLFAGRHLGRLGHGGDLGGGRALAGDLLQVPLLGRLQHKHIVGQQHQHGDHGESDRVARVLLIHQAVRLRALGRTEGGGARRLRPLSRPRLSASLRGASSEPSTRVGGLEA